ncbi:MAG: heavy-metal-associated domain-containing protein [Bdellovibrionales bacterium]
MSTYKVSGMDCQGCVKSLTRGIKGLAPDADVQVELETGRVTTTATAEQVAEAAKQSGFTFEGVAA